MPDNAINDCDIIVYGASSVHTLDSGAARATVPERLLRPSVQGNEAAALGGGKVLALGTESELRARYRPRQTLDAGGGIVAPAFLDAHTHPAFAGDRADEFEWRSEGRSYLEIAARGGGILSSVRALRQASEEQLTEAVAGHFRRMQAHGTAACEAKSGYGLSTAGELKSLRAIAAAAARTGMQVFPTFLGAHALPEEHEGHPDRYLDLLCAETLPAVREAGLARAADVYIEGHAFDLRRARLYLERARELGFALRVHAEQFENLGGARLAAELGAECADHLEALDPAGIEALAASRKTFAGLLPCAPHFLRQATDAPARQLIQAGVPYFVATDFNPGTSYTPSIPEAIHFARIRLRLSALEALAGATSNAAASLGVADRKGRIAPGYDADLVVLDLPSIEHLGYAFGENPVKHLIAMGKILF
ncbi:MAG: imidazolonepropionase [Planctomycetota bacterium]|nr:MAG: imidazolonepropionase [Planctomycetota bacterium]